ncbi:hypothetical protein [Burkholderia phage BCSR5]|nr:hypothetical protein [Burkholderia phage BCSR5]
MSKQLPMNAPMNIFDFNRIAGSKAQAFIESGLGLDALFPFLIKEMNEMYSLPINLDPTIDSEDIGEYASVRISKFLKTLQKEIDEGVEIQAQLAWFESCITPEEGDEDVPLAGIPADLKLLAAGETEISWEEARRRIIVNVADWLGDIIVYCRSEALKFGLPLEGVLNIIMGSNFTKLGEDGQPIKNAEGKVEKGPNFIAPERGIYTMLFSADELLEEANELEEAASSLRAIALPTLTRESSEVFIDMDEEDEEDDDDSFQD